MDGVNRLKIVERDVIELNRPFHWGVPKRAVSARDDLIKQRRRIHENGTFLGDLFGVRLGSGNERLGDGSRGQSQRL
jgi:hypothetical protein